MMRDRIRCNYGMRQGWRMASCVLMGCASLSGGELSGKFSELAVRNPRFMNKVSMLQREQDEYAGYLAQYAAWRVAGANANEGVGQSARRALALALHLSPRNTLAGQLNKQLTMGRVPKDVRMEYTSDALARLLQVRAEILLESTDEEDVMLGRYFLHIAHEMDARSVGLNMLYREDLKKRGVLDWAVLMGGKQ